MSKGQPLTDSPEAAAARKMSGPARAEIELAPVLAALSDPVRLRIVAMLADGGERTCGGFGLPLAKSTLTHHLKVLRDAGVIVQRPVGTTRLTCLRRADLDARFPGLLDSVLTAAAQRPTVYLAFKTGKLTPLRAPR